MGKKGVFIVVLALLIIMFSSNVVSIPDFMLADNCNFGQNIACFQGMYNINSSNENTVKVRLKNTFSSDVVVRDFSVKTKYPEIKCNDISIGDMFISEGEEFTWKKGETYVLNVDCINGDSLSVGAKERVEIRFKWYSLKSGESFEKSVDGYIVKTVYGIKSDSDKAYEHFFLIISSILLSVFAIILLYYIKESYYFSMDNKSYKVIAVFLAMIVSLFYAAIMFFFVPKNFADIIEKMSVVVFAVLSIYFFRKTPIEVEEIIDMTIVFFSYVFFGGITYFLYINAI